MTVNLNKGQGELLYYTDHYTLEPSSGAAGYDLISRVTGQVESFAEQLPGAVMALLWLQDTYDEVMADPEREFKLRKERMSAQQSVKSALVGGRGMH